MVLGGSGKACDKYLKLLQNKKLGQSDQDSDQDVTKMIKILWSATFSQRNNGIY